MTRDHATLPYRFKLKVERKGGVWFVTCPSVLPDDGNPYRGLLVAASNLAEALRQAPDALVDLVECGRQTESQDQQRKS